MNLTDSQRKIVELPPAINALIVSGPGSGKTAVLTERYKFLRSVGIDKDDLILLTFTNKAAKEMMNRISDSTSFNTDLTGTFHHFAYVILKRYQENITVLDEYRQLKIFKRLLKEAKITDVPPGDLIAQYSKERNSLSRLPMCARYHGRHITNIIEKYKEEKEKFNYVDFDDLLTKLLAILKFYPVFTRLPIVLIDEFQDTNDIQIEILKALKRFDAYFFVVADSNQSIYSFRSANVSNVLNFTKEFAPVEQYHLGENFRSTIQIINPYSEFIKNNVNRIPLELTSKKEGRKPTILKFADQFQEANVLAKIVASIYKEGSTAILYRANFQSLHLEKALTKHKIPYLIKGKVKFFEQTHIAPIADIAVFLKSKSPYVLTDFLKTFEGIGPKTAAKLAEAIPTKDTIKINDAIPKRSFSPLLFDAINLLTKDSNYKSVLINCIIQFITPYIYSSLSDPQKRIEDLKFVIEMINKSESLDDFISLAALEDNNDHDEDKAVVLSTIHSAKGLEWNNVIVSGITTNVFPHHRSVAEGSLEEERRLLYVAMSRARKNLYLSFIGWSQFLKELRHDFFIT